MKRFLGCLGLILLTAAFPVGAVVGIKRPLYGGLILLAAVGAVCAAVWLDRRAAAKQARPAGAPRLVWDDEGEPDPVDEQYRSAKRLWTDAADLTSPLGINGRRQGLTAAQRELAAEDAAYKRHLDGLGDV